MLCPTHRIPDRLRSAWELAVHLAETDVWFLESVVHQHFGVPIPSGATTIAELSAWYKAHLPAKLEQVLALDGAQLAPEVTFYNYKMPNAQYLIFCAVHGAHHRGQLSAYLRPMGGKVPSIYGGSADEPYKM